MDNKATPLWDANCEAPRGLRTPNAPPNRLLEGTSKSANNIPENLTAKPTNSQGNANPAMSRLSADPETKRTSNSQGNVNPVVSRLSAEAPEFVPKYMKSQSRSGVQDRLKKHKVTESSAQQSANIDSEFVGSPDDNRLQHLIATLTKDPGQFSDLVELFMDTLWPYLQDIIVLSRTAQLLVQQAIENPSFRYTAARLCCYIEQSCPEFRAELHLTCQKELKNNSNKSGLLLFVAELYTQLHHENIYGSYLIDAYKHLLAAGGNDNVKSICQALKLTGSSLELYDKKALDEVFEKLNAIKPNTTGTALSLINSVVNLRNTNWGRASPTNISSDAETENTYWDEAPNTVFYNTDGFKLTAEENEFLAAHMNTEEFATDLSDPDELCDPEPEMDEEIREAFKVFVKLKKSSI